MHVLEPIKVPIESILHGGVRCDQAAEALDTLSDDEIYMARNSEHNEV